MGDDFTYQNAKLNFQSIDRFIEYFNKNSGTKYKAIYSTPGQYLDAIKS